MSSIPPLPTETLQIIVKALADDDGEDLSSTKACSLVSSTFLLLCRKHIFASIVLDGHRTIPPQPNTANLIRLLSKTPEIADHIRYLDCYISDEEFDQPSLPKILMLITKLEGLKLRWPRYKRRWDSNPLRMALLHLLHLPTLIRLSLSDFANFLVSDLIACTSLRRLAIESCKAIEQEEFALHSPLPSRSVPLRYLSADPESLQTISTLCTTLRPDGKPIIDFCNLSSVSFHLRHGLSQIKDLFRLCEQLEYVSIFFHSPPATWYGLHDMLSPSQQTLRHLELKSMLNDETGAKDPLSGLTPELEEMSNQNRVESIDIEVHIQTDFDCHRGDLWGALDKALAGSEAARWPKLTSVSLKITIWSFSRQGNELEVALEMLPKTQFPLLSSSKAISFQFSVENVSA